MMELDIFLNQNSFSYAQLQTSNFLLHGVLNCIGCSWSEDYNPTHGKVVCFLLLTELKECCGLRALRNCFSTVTSPGVCKLKSRLLKKSRLFFILTLVNNTVKWKCELKHTKYKVARVYINKSFWAIVMTVI